MLTNHQWGIVTYPARTISQKILKISILSKNDWFKILSSSPRGQWVNTLRPRQNGRHFPDDILEWIFLNENVWILIEISLKFVPKGQINNIPVLVQIMAWRRPGDKPLSESMMVSLLTPICVTRPQCVNTASRKNFDKGAQKGYTRKIILWMMTSNSLTENEEHDILSQI